MSKTKVIAFANNKGGSGKTTTCSNVGCAMAMQGKKVLLLDGDMQLNLTISFFDEEKAYEYARGEKNVYRAIKEEKDLSDYVVETDIPGVDLIPSTSLMSSVEFDLFAKWQREFVLKKSMERLRAKGYYDYILIDAPPTLGGWVMNIMCASDYVVIPVEASPWGLFGLANMFEFFNQAKTIAPQLKILGIAITKADERKKYFKQTFDTLKATEGVRLFENYIRVDSAVEWAQDNSKPVVAYKKTSRSAVEYINLTKEIIRYANR
ncbi:MAG: AAA family ATPase [Candidatus Borkfalkiaceae bacterium]|nr:AAA family ATPase [Clostridia bacterium]MDY6223454.1 AAA family ATPase [Christensenellaceae bacterium]